MSFISCQELAVATRVYKSLVVFRSMFGATKKFQRDKNRKENPWTLEKTMVPKTVSNYSCQPKWPIFSIFCWISPQITFTWAKDTRNPCCSLHLSRTIAGKTSLFVSQNRAPLCQEEPPWPCFASSGPGTTPKVGGRFFPATRTWNVFS